MKKIYILIVIGIIIISGGFLIFSNKPGQPPSNQVAKTPRDRIFPEEIGKEVVLVIDDGEGNPNNFVVEFREGMTAFDLLKNKADESGIVLKTKVYDIGILVEAISDKKNGQDGKYWLYYINGEMPMVAADKKEIKAGDKVEFKFEESSF